MTLPRWTPFFAQTVNNFDHVMKQLFQDFRADVRARPVLSPDFPLLNLWEDDDHLYVEAELPGVAADQLVVHVNQGNLLTLEGERQPTAELKGDWLRQERGFGKFSRVVELPVAIDSEKVEARFEQGVLSLKLPKAAAAKPRRIPVQVQ